MALADELIGVGRGGGHKDSCRFFYMIQKNMQLNSGTGVSRLFHRRDQRTPGPQQKTRPKIETCTHYYRNDKAPEVITASIPTARARGVDLWVDGSSAWHAALGQRCAEERDFRILRAQKTLPASCMSHHASVAALQLWTALETAKAR